MADLPDAEILRRADGGDSISLPDRTAAVLSAGRRHLKEAPAKIRTALADKDHFIRLVALSGAEAMGGDEGLDLLWEAARNATDPATRNEALSKMALWGHDEVLKAAAFAWGLNDPSAIGAATAKLWRFADDPAVMAYVERALQHPDQRVWQEGIAVLAERADQDALRRLKALYDSIDPVAHAAMRENLEWALNRAYQKLTASGWRSQTF